MAGSSTAKLATLVLATLAVPAMSAQPRQPSAAPQPPTFKSGVEYVEVDVVVTNSQGQFVRDLTRNDFELTEDGKRQSLTSFALVDVPIEKYGDRPPAAHPAIEPDVTTNAQALEGRTYVMVLDDLHTDPGRVQRTKAAARQFIEQQLGASDVMAVVHTAGADIANQAFTGDKTRLLEAVDRTTGRTVEAATGNADFDTAADLERAAQASGTLQVLRDVSNWFANVRGRRKSILFVSEGVDYDITRMDNADAQNRPWDVVIDATRDAVEAATRSNVSIYGIDPLGLTDVEGARGRGHDLQVRHDSLRVLSDQTGGMAIVGQNDLARGYAQIVSDNSTYYVLAYEAPSHKRDGKFHAIGVHVDRPGLVARARPGYLSASGKAPAAASGPAGSSRELLDALTSPLPVAGVTMHVSLTPFRGTAPNASVLITADVRGRDLALESDDTLAWSYAAVDVHGKTLAASNDAIKLTGLKPDTRTRIEQTGLRIFNRVALPPGRYQMRIAARDEASGRLGSVAYDLDVPDFYKLPLSVSGLALTSLSTGAMVAANADAQMKGALPAPPGTDRTFAQNGAIAAFAEVYDNAGNSPHTIAVETTLTSGTGQVAYRAHEEHASSELSLDRGRLQYTVRVPLNVEPGRYVLSVSAATRAARDEHADRQVEITVTGGRD